MIKRIQKNLRDAINNGSRIIVTTLQKFPVIYQEVDKVAGRNFAIIVDEAHSSQTGSSAMKRTSTSRARTSTTCSASPSI